MTTVFATEGDNLYTAFYEPNAKKRKKALDKWIKKTTPSVQKAVTEELRSLVEFVTQDRWTDEGWKRGEAKLRRIQPDYHLVMDIKLRSLTGRDLKSYKGELPASAFRKQEKPRSGQRKVEDEDDDYVEEGRSPNDERSDSMNPNNDAYQASMDNRSDQMNPKNPTYWSSRGR